MSYSYDYFPKIREESVKNKKGEIDVKKLVRCAAVANKTGRKRRTMENVCETRRLRPEEEYPEEKKDGAHGPAMLLFFIYFIIFIAIVIKAVVAFFTAYGHYIVGFLVIAGIIKLLYHFISKIIEKRQPVKTESKPSNTKGDIRYKSKSKRRNGNVHKVKGAKVILITG